MNELEENDLDGMLDGIQDRLKAQAAVMAAMALALINAGVIEKCAFMGAVETLEQEFRSRNATTEGIQENSTFRRLVELGGSGAD